MRSSHSQYPTRPLAFLFGAGIAMVFLCLIAGLIISGMIIGTAIVSSQMWQLKNAGQEFLPVIAVLVFMTTLFIGTVMVWRTLNTRPSYSE